ncbi:MAG: hypothetical protein R2991_13925 [Thermoanaerobaculia bacterium]
MSGKTLTILTVLGLACAPLAAQTSEDPMRDDPSLQEQQQTAPDAPAVSDQTDLQSEAAADVRNDQSVEDPADEELPKTASPLALLALLGSAGVATGTGLKLRRRR